MSKSNGLFLFWLALIGGLAGLVLAHFFSDPVSTAVIRLTAISSTDRMAPRDLATRQLQERLANLRESLERDELMRWMRELSLFTRERALYPDEDVAEQFRDGGAIQMRPIDAHDDDPLRAVNVRVSVAYPDAGKAQVVLWRLVDSWRKRNASLNDYDAARWQHFWHGDLPWRDSFDVPVAPTLPARFSQQDAVFLFGGMAGAILLGVAVLWISANPARAWRVGVCGILGFGVVVGISWLSPARYTYAAVMEVGIPLDPSHYSGTIPAPSLGDVVDSSRLEILGDPRASGATQLKPASEETVAGFRVQPDASAEVPGSSFEVWASDPDPAVSKSVVNELVSRLGLKHRSPDKGEEAPPDAIEFLVAKPAKEVKISHWSNPWTAMGLLFGILVGASLPVRSTAG